MDEKKIEMTFTLRQLNILGAALAERLNEKSSRDKWELYDMVCEAFRELRALHDSGPEPEDATVHHSFT